MTLLAKLIKMAIFAGVAPALGAYGWQNWGEDCRWYGPLASAGILTLGFNPWFDGVMYGLGRQSVVISKALAAYFSQRCDFTKFRYLGQICWLKFRMVWNASWLVSLHLFALVVLAKPFFESMSYADLVGTCLTYFLLGSALVAALIGTNVVLWRFAGHWTNFGEPNSQGDLASEYERASAHFGRYYSFSALLAFVGNEICVIVSLLHWLISELSQHDATIAGTVTSLGIWLGLALDSWPDGAITASLMGVLWLYLRESFPLLAQTPPRFRRDEKVVLAEDWDNTLLEIMVVSGGSFFEKKNSAAVVITAIQILAAPDQNPPTTPNEKGDSLTRQLTPPRLPVGETEKIEASSVGAPSYSFIDNHPD